MHHSSLATISKNGIQISSDLLTPLSIRNGTKVWAVYYTTPKSTQKDQDIKNDKDSSMKYHDLLITPIPYMYWPFCARIRIYMKHETENCLYRISKVMKERNVSIICGEASRSDHSYTTYTATIVFEGLKEKFTQDLKLKDKEQPGDTDKQDIETDVEGELQVEIGNLINSICDEDRSRFCQEDKTEQQPFLLSEREISNFFPKGKRSSKKDVKDPSTCSIDITPPSSVGCMPLNILSSFYKKTISPSLDRSQPSEEGNQILNDKVTLWKLTCQDGELVPDEDTLYSMKYYLHNSLPSRAFAEMDTRNVTIRMAIIPSENLSKFISIVVHYEWKKSSNSQSTMGLFFDITKLIKKQNYDIWRFTTYPIISMSEIETGSLEYFVKRNNIISADQDPLAGLEVSLKTFEQENEHIKLLGTTKVIPISFIKIFVSTKLVIAKRENIRKICQEIGEKNGIFPNDIIMVTEEDYEAPTESIFIRVANKLRDVDAMIQYYGPKVSSEEVLGHINDERWLFAERLAAEALKIPIWVVLDDGRSENDIQTIGHQVIVVNQYIERESAKTAAIQDAINKIKAYLKKPKIT